MCDPPLEAFNSHGRADYSELRERARGSRPPDKVPQFPLLAVICFRPPSLQSDTRRCCGAVLLQRTQGEETEAKEEGLTFEEDRFDGLTIFQVEWCSTQHRHKTQIIRVFQFGFRLNDLWRLILSWKIQRSPPMNFKKLSHNSAGQTSAIECLSMKSKQKCFWGRAGMFKVGHWANACLTNARVRLQDIFGQHVRLGYRVRNSFCNLA